MTYKYEIINGKPMIVGMSEQTMFQNEREAYRAVLELPQYPMLEPYPDFEGRKDLKEGVDFVLDYVSMNDGVKKKLTAIHLPQSKPVNNEFFLPPDHNEECWEVGAGTFTRKEVSDLLHTQRAMIINDIKSSCPLSENLIAILKNPRIPKF